MKRIVPMLLLPLVLTCGQWKVSAYKATKVCTLKSGNRPGQVMVRVGEDGMFNLSFAIRLFRGRIYVTDNTVKRLQVLDRDGAPQLLIGEKAPVAQGEGPAQSSFNFGVLGHVAVDSDNNIYVQNLFVSKNPSEGASEELDFSPSYILKFDSDGKLQYTLGKLGQPNMPFDYIDNIDIDRKDRLFVVSRKFNTWSVSRFDGKKRDIGVNFAATDFRERDGEGEFQGRIDNVRVLKDGENFLVSVAYYSGLRFKYRKIFNYSVRDSRFNRTIMTIPDPKNELFSVVDDMHLYLWNIDDGQTRFIICNMDGSIINNVRLRFNEKKYYYRDVQMDDAGLFYSYEVKKDSVDIVEWR